MAKDGVQIKIMKIWEILVRFSDEENPLSTYDIVEKLQEEGISCDRRTIGKDIAILRKNGYEIFSELSKRTMYYHIADRRFEIAELRILLDAVQSAAFITRKKTETLTQKIANLVGQRRAELLRRSILYNSVKHTNENIFYSIDRIDDAIAKGRKIVFRYFDFNVRGERIYRRNGEQYEVNPVCTVLEGNCYYLLCYSATHHDRLGHYRIDRMTDVNSSEEPISPSKEIERLDLTKYREELFDMFGGESTQVKLTAKADLIDVILDRFGEQTKLQDNGDGTFHFQAEVQFGPTFIAWCCGFGDRLRIDAPEILRLKVKKYIEALLKNY